MMDYENLFHSLQLKILLFSSVPIVFFLFVTLFVKYRALHVTLSLSHDDFPIRFFFLTCMIHSKAIEFINPQCQSNFTNEYFSWKWNIFGEHFGPLVINAIDQSVNEVVDCSMAP